MDFVFYAATLFCCSIRLKYYFNLHFPNKCIFIQESQIFAVDWAILRVVRLCATKYVQWLYFKKKFQARSNGHHSKLSRLFSVLLTRLPFLSPSICMHTHALSTFSITISISSLNYRTFRQCCKTQRYIYLLLWNLIANKRKKNNKILHSMHCLYCYLHC